jgi:hypothetical protein
MRGELLNAQERLTDNFVWLLSVGRKGGSGGRGGNTISDLGLDEGRTADHSRIDKFRKRFLSRQQHKPNLNNGHLRSKHSNSHTGVASPSAARSPAVPALAAVSWYTVAWPTQARTPLRRATGCPARGESCDDYTSYGWSDTRDREGGRKEEGREHTGVLDDAVEVVALTTAAVNDTRSTLVWHALQLSY